jgi:hypothetical protein
MEIMQMGQNRITGRAGHHFGHEMAIRVARFLDTELLSPKSNEITLDGELFVIKSAKLNTSSIGITVTMFGRLQGIIAAFENDAGGFMLYKLELKRNTPLQMVFSQSSSHKKNKVIKISRKFIEKYGETIGNID